MKFRLGIMLIGSFVFMALLTAIVGIIGFSGIKTVARSLTQVGDEDDAIGMALEKTGEDLNTLVAEITMATEQIATGSRQWKT